MAANSSQAPKGFREVLTYLEERRHRLPGGGFITLNTFRKQFKRCDFSAVQVLNAHFPDTARAMKAASLARRLSQGKPQG